MATSETAGKAADPKAKATQQAPAEVVPADPGSLGVFGMIQHWFRVEGAWWAASFVFHMLLMCVIMLLSSAVVTEELGDAPTFEAADAKDMMDNSPPPLERFELNDETPLDPAELSTETLSLNTAPDPNEEMVDGGGFLSSENDGGGMAMAMNSGPTLGGLGTGFDVVGMGAGVSVRGSGGIGVGIGTGTSPGSGGSGVGFSGRSDSGRKAGIGGYGGTKRSERAVAAALNWLARHQNNSGAWNLKDYPKLCKDNTCTGPGEFESDPGATAMALLPFLAAGQTHETKGPYKNTVYKGLYWLMQNQRPDGDLAPGVKQKMYSHGLAAITLCEAYGLTKDRMIGQRAQQALNYIMAAQHPAGGWRYEPGEEGDTSVVGWQVMALKSGAMSGLKVDAKCFERAKAFLKSVSKGNYGGQYAYMPDQGPTNSMTAVGLLCQQYMGMHRDDNTMQEGVQALMRKLPDNNDRNLYYWYYATQVLHNIPGPDWDNWNRKTREVLIGTQCREGCATGSWDPEKPMQDRWGDRGGRIYVTSLACLSLEVYYRYLPLYKLDSQDAIKQSQAAPKAEEKKPEDRKAEEKKSEAKPEAEKKPAAESKPAEKKSAEKKGGDDKKGGGQKKAAAK